MWAYLTGLALLALVFSHTSSTERQAFVDTGDVLEKDGKYSIWTLFRLLLCSFLFLRFNVPSGRWGRHLLASNMVNCTPPAIEEFPRPLIPQYARAKGGLIIHLLVSAYMFLGLSIVCDDYFVPALERMVECKSPFVCRA